MIKLKKYLKPYISGLVFAIALLFIQAICDLNLPNYMSDIVNVGIQQNGIDNATPDGISVEGYNFLTLFMDKEEKLLMESSYKKVQDNDSYNFKNTYKDIYPKMKDEIYVINDDLSKDKINQISDIFGTTTWTMINTLQSLNTNNENKNFSTDMQKMNMEELYKLTPVISSLDKNIIYKASIKTNEMDDMFLETSGTMLVSNLYEELGIDLGDIQTKYIINIGIIMLLITLLSGTATILVSFISSRLSAGVAKNLRKDIFEKVESFSNLEYDKFGSSSLITRCTNDITQIQLFLMMGIRMICYAPIIAIGGTIMALSKSISMAWIIAAAVVALIGLILVIVIIVLPKFKILQKLVDKINLVTRETLNGLMVIRAFGTQKYEKKRFDKANADFAKTNLFVSRTMTFMMPSMMLIMNLTSILIVWVGSHQINDSIIQIGDMMAYIQYAMLVIMSFLMISIMFIFIPRASVSALRINEILETNPSIKDPIKAKNMNNSKLGVVEFKNVSFKYEGAKEEVLYKINFFAQPKQTTAFIGSTGSGKTTILNLIPRFYDATNGEVLVGGVNVKDLKLKTLREKIGYITQKSILMSGTIESNIKYGGNNINDANMKKSASIAQAEEFINSKEDNYNDEVAQKGSNLSGGQKQRLAIARALAINPDIFIFDDSFSALDFKTDAKLRKELNKNVKNKTIIIVAQRVSTIMNADIIYVIDEGKIVGSGTHKELLKSCKEYYEIASSQLKKEEL